MMAVVAVAAVAMLVLVKPFCDRARWSQIAQHHSRQAEIYLSRATSVSQNDPGSYEKLFTRFKWHRSMAARYARSAAYPGMPEPRESPPPDQKLLRFIHNWRLPPGPGLAANYERPSGNKR
jgi:hypothetical protein